MEQQMLLASLKDSESIAKWQIWRGKLVGSDEWNKWKNEFEDRHKIVWYNWLRSIKEEAKQTQVLQNTSEYRIGILKSAKVFNKDSRDRSGHSYFDSKSFQQVISDLVRCYDAYVGGAEYPIPNNLSDVLRSLICIYQQYIQSQPSMVHSMLDLMGDMALDTTYTKIDNFAIAATSTSLSPMKFQELLTEVKQPVAQREISEIEIYELLNATL
jgi:hypothetical protein